MKRRLDLSFCIQRSLRNAAAHGGHVTLLDLLWFLNHWGHSGPCLAQAPGTSYKGSGPSCSAYVSCFWLLPSDAAVLLAKVEVERAAMAKASKAPVKQLHQVRIVSSAFGSERAKHFATCLLSPL